MSLRYTISAGLFLLCSSALPVSAGDTQIVSGYAVPLREQDAASEGYQRVPLSAAFAAKNRGYTNDNAPVGFLCRALIQPIGSNVYMMAEYKTIRGCESMYEKTIE